MGCAIWFKTFCGNLQVRNRATITSRYASITRRLNKDFWSTTSDTTHSLYVGSYGRRTATYRTSDVDVIYELPWSQYHRYNAYASNGQSALLQAVRDSLKTTYPNTRIAADGQVVEVSFHDGIPFDVVPGFSNRDGSYTHPDSNCGGTWEWTNPRPEIQAIRLQDECCNGNMRHLCRMMRAWKAHVNVPMRGLLVDTLAYRFIGSWSHRKQSYLYYDYMSRDFFDFLSHQDTDQEYWIAPGSGQRVLGQKGQFQYKARRSYNLALEAIQHETAGHEYLAKHAWREIFGTSFSI